MDLAKVITRELDRQERVINRPDYQVDIGRLSLKIRFGKPLNPQEIKIVEASQTLTDYLLEVSNPFGVFADDDDSVDTDSDLCGCSSCNRIDLPDFSPKG